VRMPVEDFFSEDAKRRAIDPVLRMPQRSLE